MTPRRFFLGRAIGFAAVLGILGLVGAFYALNNYIYQEKQGDGTVIEPYRASFSGTFVCLPHKDTTGPQTEECAFGIELPAGDYYALDTALMSQMPPEFSAGDYITASGTVTPIERLSSDQWQKYDVAGIFSVTDSVRVQKPARNYKDASYLIDGQQVTLQNGFSEVPAAPDSASKITTRYFGNEAYEDLNGDGREDVVFLLTQNTGGSGTFFYAVGAVITDDGYVGTDGYLLGDRIAPQTINPSPNPRHKDVVVVNYADRAAGEPMSAQPSVGKSAYLKLDSSRMQWGIVVPDFEGESR